MTFDSIVQKHQSKNTFWVSQVAEQPFRYRQMEDRFQQLLRLVLFKHRLNTSDSQHDEETKNSEQLLLNQTVEKIN